MKHEIQKSTRKENKENVRLSKQLTSNPISQKIQKFGKSIRAKALPRYDTTHPLTPLQIRNNDSYNRQSLALSEEKPLIQDISGLSISFISHMDDKVSQFDEFSQSRFLRNKNVRFYDPDESFQTSKSRSLRRSSILKNSRFSDKQSSASFNSHIGSICQGLSAKSSVRDKGVLCQNSKYQTVLKKLVHQNKKFFDDMFPPGGASLFYTKTQTEKYKDVRWVRIDQVFSGKKLVLYSHSDRNTVKIGNFLSLDYMASAFNALGRSSRCIEKIFEEQKYSRYGLYFLRLNHGGIWKYVIVDDYIPVRKIGRSYVPIFLNIKPPKSQYYEIWPFILQKALAKMYSTYQSLMGDKFQNCLNELTGLHPQRIDLKEKDSSTIFKIKNYLLNPDNILIAKEPAQNEKFRQKIFPISEILKDQSSYFTQNENLQLVSALNENILIDYRQLITKFSAIDIYLQDDRFYSVGCIIKQKRNTMSLRKFVVDGYGHANISVIQKDKKYYRNNGYKYVWMRVMLVLKDFDGYRWIGGAYSNQKCINMKSLLQPGQYFIIIMGEWDAKIFDITLNYQGNLQTQIIRQNIQKYPDILQQTCRDLSQRFGVFRQLSKNLCSYQYMDKKNGFLIENLNNQINREVYYQRKYCLPFSNIKSVGNVHLSPQNEIQGFIEPDQSLTLVLMILGGLDTEKLEAFEF